MKVRESGKEFKYLCFKMAEVCILGVGRGSVTPAAKNALYKEKCHRMQ
jgi:hypothetical protein